MKKAGVFIIIFVLILSLTLISAFSFSDFLNKLTGKVVVEESCVDSGNGFDPYHSGTVTYTSLEGKERTWQDSCLNDSFLQEFYCDGDSLRFEVYECANGCLDWVCIVPEEFLELSIPFCEKVGRSIGWYEEGVKGGYLTVLRDSGCEGCSAFFVSTEDFKPGWYDSCGGKLIKQDLSLTGIDVSSDEESKTNEETESEEKSEQVILPEGFEPNTEDGESMEMIPSGGLEEFFCEDGTKLGTCSGDRRLCTITKNNLDPHFEDSCFICGCDEGQECGDDGVCFEKVQNVKNMDKYSEKEIFIISDEDWKEVLSFVPVTVWTDENGEVQKYPYVVYEKEGIYSGTSFVDLIKKYYPATSETFLSKVNNNFINKFLEWSNLMDDEGNFEVGTLKFSGFGSLLSYWESYEDVVYVKNDYETALLASTYASLINAPLIIRGTVNDEESTYKNKNVICVGDKNLQGGVCDEFYSLEELRDKYVEETNTDKVIVVNVEDQNGIYATYEEDSMVLDSGLNVFGFSLLAPILASAKHELLYSLDVEYESGLKYDIGEEKLTRDISHWKLIDSMIEEIFDKYAFDYLTIFSDFYSIPHTIENGELFGDTYDIALDPGFYADFGSDKKPDVAVGRISGLDCFDVSLYLVRDIFYETFPKTGNALFLASSFNGILASNTKTLSIPFENLGYDISLVTSDKERVSFNKTLWENKDIIYYTDHSGSYWAGMFHSQIPLLDNSLVVIAGCLTVSTPVSEFNRFRYSEDNLVEEYTFSVGHNFWTRAISQGAIGFVGATSITFLSSPFGNFLEELYNSGGETDLGTAFKTKYSNGFFTAMMMLVGDPTLKVSEPCVPVGESVSSGEYCCYDYRNEVKDGRCCVSSGQGCTVQNQDLCCSGICEAVYGNTGAVTGGICK